MKRRARTRPTLSRKIGTPSLMGGLALMGCTMTPQGDTAPQPRPLGRELAVYRASGERPAGASVTGVVTKSRLQLTNASDLLALNRHYLTHGGDTPQLAPQSVGQHTHLITPLRIEENTTIGPGCVIGPRVYIERNCQIGADVLIKDAVILRDTVNSCVV